MMRGLKSLMPVFLIISSAAYSTASELVVEINVTAGSTTQRIVIGVSSGATDSFDMQFDVPALFDGNEEVQIFIFREASGFENVTQFWKDFVRDVPAEWIMKVINKTRRRMPMRIEWSIKGTLPSWNRSVNRCFYPGIYLEDVERGVEVLMGKETKYTRTLSPGESVFKIRITDSLLKKVAPPDYVKVKGKGNYAVVRWKDDGALRKFFVYGYVNGKVVKLLKQPVDGHMAVLKLDEPVDAFGVQAVDENMCRSSIRWFQ